MPYKPKRAFHGLRRFVVNELGDLQLAGWWVGQSSLRVTAGYERDRMERLNEARERLDRKEVATETATNMSTSSGRRATRAHHYRRFYIAASPPAVTARS